MEKTVKTLTFFISLLYEIEKTIKILTFFSIKTFFKWIINQYPTDIH